MSTTYGIGTTLPDDMEIAEKRVREALAAEGFGILSEIDVAATLKEKLGVDRASYKILGACNPELANQALGIDEHIGLLLPCNVILYDTGDGTAVEAVDPGTMMEVAHNPDLEPVAAEAKERLTRAIHSIR